MACRLQLWRSAGDSTAAANLGCILQYTTRIVIPGQRNTALCCRCKQSLESLCHLVGNLRDHKRVRFI